MCKYGSCPHSFCPHAHSQYSYHDCNFSCACSRYSYTFSQFFVPSFPFVVRALSMSPPRSAAIKQKCLIVPPCARSPSTAALRCISRCCALHSARCLSRVARCILRAACCAHSDSRLFQSAFACVIGRSSRARPPPHVRRMTSCTRRRRCGRRPPSALRACVRARVRSRACVRACMCVCL